MKIVAFLKRLGILTTYIPPHFLLRGLNFCSRFLRAHIASTIHIREFLLSLGKFLGECQVVTILNDTMESR